MNVLYEERDVIHQEMQTLFVIACILTVCNFRELDRNMLASLGMIVQ